MRHHAGTGKALPMAGPGHRHARTSYPLARSKHQTRWTSLPMAGPRLQLRRTLPAYGRTKTSNSPGLAAFGRTDTSNSPDLPACGRTVRQTYVRPAGPPCLWPDRPRRFGTYKVTEWREGVQPQKTWIQKRIWKPRSSRFSSPTSIVCQGLVQTGLALHPMSRNRWSLEISSLKMFRLQCGLFLTQDVSPAVWGMAPS